MQAIDRHLARDRSDRGDVTPVEIGRWNTSGKRAVDLVGAIVIALLAAPAMVLTAFLVKLTSRGPAIYWQTRLGRDGLPYTIYKFRTMAHECERESGPQWSTRGDSRVTPLGRFLRASHLDELPQLWNVVRGEMSLIGPRPERPVFAGPLARALPCYADRLRVRPGVTGLAQVQLAPDTNLESVRRKLAYDLYYVRRAGLLLDLQIVLSTATGVAGIPFDVSNRLLGLPDARVVEEVGPAPACSENEASGLRQIQPASA